MGFNLFVTAAHRRLQLKRDLGEDYDKSEYQQPAGFRYSPDPIQLDLQHAGQLLATYFENLDPSTPSSVRARLTMLEGAGVLQRETRDGSRVVTIQPVHEPPSDRDQPFPAPDGPAFYTLGSWQSLLRSSHGWSSSWIEKQTRELEAQGAIQRAEHPSLGRIVLVHDHAALAELIPPVDAWWILS